MTTAAPDRVDATTVRTWLDQPERVTVLDVRRPAEFETARIPGSINMPLSGAGAHHQHVLEGGVSAFRSAGGEVIEGRAHWSLERQVRLVAGSLVLASLAATVRTPKAGLLASGVAAGLTLSALTDSCIMGGALSVLHYNRGPKDRSPEEVLDQLPAPPPT